MSKIIITTWPLKDNDDDINKGCEDEVLSNHLFNYMERMLEDKPDMEIYERKGNICATSIGYFGAFHEEDLVKA